MLYCDFRVLRLVIPKGNELSMQPSLILLRGSHLGSLTLILLY